MNITNLKTKIAQSCRLVTGADMEGNEIKYVPMIDFNTLSKIITKEMTTKNKEEGAKVPEHRGEETTRLGVNIEQLREELSRGCEYAATQEVVHQSFYEAMEELGGTGDWDEMAAEDIKGQMCVLQPLFEIFYDRTVEKVLNYVESYVEGD